VGAFDANGGPVITPSFLRAGILPVRGLRYRGIGEKVYSFGKSLQFGHRAIFSCT
jgi:hypothetical protein